MIKLQNIYAGYYNKDVIKDININFKAGQITTLIGPNGCGKSTIIKVMSRIIKASRGSVLVNDSCLNDLKFYDLAKQISVLPQLRTAPSIDVETLVSFGRFTYTGFLRTLSNTDKTFIEKAMEDTGIVKLRHKKLEEISGGERQKVFIAMCLAQNTNIMLLDEPTTFLDINYQLEILELLKKLNKMGKTIIMVLHDLAQAIAYSHCIVVIESGRVVDAGTPKEIVGRGTIDRVFKVESKCFHHDEKSYYYFEHIRDTCHN